MLFLIVKFTLCLHVFLCWQVDEQGVAVPNSWQDCKDGCPGTGSKNKETKKIDSFRQNVYLNAAVVSNMWKDCKDGCPGTGRKNKETKKGSP